MPREQSLVPWAARPWEGPPSALCRAVGQGAAASLDGHCPQHPAPSTAVLRLTTPYSRGQTEAYMPHEESTAFPSCSLSLSWSFVKLFFSMCYNPLPTVFY